MKKARIKELLNFNKIHVTVLGDVMLDEYKSGHIDRISPEAPVPIVNLSQLEHKLGGAANVALNTLNLGAKTTLIGLLGEDENGKIIKDLCKNKNGLNTIFVTDKKRRTTCKTRIIAKNQQLLRIDEEDTLPSDDSIVSKVLNKLDEIHKINPISILIFQDYNKGFFSKNMIKELMLWTSSNKVTSCLDPKYNNILLFKGIDLFKPNLRELNSLLKEKIEGIDEKIKLKVERTFNILDPSIILLTMGSEGVFISNKLESHLEPALTKPIIDVSGAGDSVISLTALLYYNKEASLEEISKLANYAGAAACSMLGVGIIDTEMISGYGEE